MEPFNLLVVCGPTASGKTALAVALARELGGEIISADSRQVYRGLDIGSGKDLDEYEKGGEKVQYHLIDIADLADTYTLHHYQRDFRRVFEKVRGRGRVPVMCGGTGLYIEAVLRNYELAEVPEDALLRERLMPKDKQELTLMLRDLDKSLCSVTDLSSKKRIVRAIEIIMHRGEYRPRRYKTRLPGIEPLVLCTRWEHAALRERIGRRLDERLSSGMIDEVRTLRQSGIPDTRLLGLGMEYRYITLYLRGEIGYEEMVVKLRHSIIQLAKRQKSWFRGMERRGVTVHWVEEAGIARAREVISKYGC